MHMGNAYWLTGKMGFAQEEFNARARHRPEQLRRTLEAGELDARGERLQR